MNSIAERVPNCQKCGQHGRKSRLKGHKRVCPFRDCNCAKVYIYSPVPVPSDVLWNTSVCALVNTVVSPSPSFSSSRLSLLHLRRAFPSPLHSARSDPWLMRMSLFSGWDHSIPRPLRRLIHVFKTWSTLGLSCPSSLLRTQKCVLLPISLSFLFYFFVLEPHREREEKNRRTEKRRRDILEWEESTEASMWREEKVVQNIEGMEWEGKSFPCSVFYSVLTLCSGKQWNWGRSENKRGPFETPRGFLSHNRFRKHQLYASRRFTRKHGNIFISSSIPSFLFYRRDVWMHTVVDSSLGFIPFSPPFGFIQWPSQVIASIVVETEEWKNIQTQLKLINN